MLHNKELTDNLFNLSLSSRTFPVKWKIADVIPLLIVPNPSTPNKLSLVSLLPILGKILEQLVQDQLAPYLDKLNCSTSTSVTSVQGNLLKQFNHQHDSLEIHAMPEDRQEQMKLPDSNASVRKGKTPELQTSPSKDPKGYFRNEPGSALPPFRAYQI